MCARPCLGVPYGVSLNPPHRRDRSSAIPRKPAKRKPSKRKAKPSLRVQYAALPYRFNADAALEFLLVTSRQTKRWIIPKGWPIKGLKPARSAAREAFEEAGVRGKLGLKPLGAFSYDKMLDDNGKVVACEVNVFPLLVRRQSPTWREFAERVTQWVEPAKAAAMVKEEGLQKIIAAFTKRLAAAANKAAL